MNSIEKYIQEAPVERRATLTELYHFIQKTVPEAEEKISYGMPTFYLKGNLVHFSNAKNHIGFYPTPSAVTAFQDRLTSYKTSKGAIQFPLDKELPWPLIRDIVLFRKNENLN